MPRLLALPLLLTLLAAPPLSDSQKERLSTARDRTDLVDEPAFYALLENAATSPGDDLGATIPDYAAILDRPADARGQLFLLEGTLESEVPTEPLTRGNWQKVRGIAVRLANGKPVIVYLTDPPELSTIAGLLRDRSASIRIPARFYKIITSNNRAGEPTDFLVFVGKAPTHFDTYTGPSNGAFVITVVVAVIVFLGIRLHLMRKRREGKQSRLEDYLEERRLKRRVDEEAADAESAASLPDDPAEAMRQLADQPKTRDD
jgi:hypothetical protein